MRINFVTSNLAPFRIDWLDELSKYVEVSIFYNDDKVKDVNEKYLKRRPIHAKYIRISKKIFGELKIFNFKKIFDNEVDLLILDGYGFYSQLLLIVLLKLKKKKFILSIDGGFINNNESKIKFLIKKYLVSSASYYLSTSTLTDEFLMYYGARKHQIYRHFFTSIYKKDIKNLNLNNTKVKTDLRKKLNLEEKVTVIAVGKFVSGKGFDLLLKAMKHFEKNINVLIVGGKETYEYKEIISRDFIKNVKFIDFCDSETLKKYYDASDIFILPTKSDVWGLVINEAMARGLPIITTDMCVAGKSLVKDDENGYIIPVNDVNMIAKYINILAINEEKRIKMGEKNIELIHQYTHEESAINDLLNFQNILKGERNE